MFITILKMAGVTALYVILTILLWRRTRGKRVFWGGKLLIGLIYGLCSVLSTHFAIDYNHMLLNVRDLGPLAAGLFFDPVSGIIAGLIGGIERYIAGAYWGVGSYTRIACSVSTCLAGFLSAFLHTRLFRRKMPSTAYAFIMGAVMEVFHMYVVIITHRDDMEMALYVVKVCAVPMIVFTGLGLAACSVSLKIMAGEWSNPFRRVERENVPLSHRFQVSLFIVSFAMLGVHLLFSFFVQTHISVQNARNTLTNSISDIRETYANVSENLDAADLYSRKTLLTDTTVIAAVVESTGDPESVDSPLLDRLSGIYQLESVVFTGPDGKTTITSGTPVEGLTQFFSRMEDNYPGGKILVIDSWHIAACVPCLGGSLQTTVDLSKYSNAMNLDNMANTLSYFHVGATGSFDIIAERTFFLVGSHYGAQPSQEELAVLKDMPLNEFFTSRLFGVDFLGRMEILADNVELLVQLPLSEIYAEREAQLYEVVFADIILFAVIYVLISQLVQSIVVNNLSLVNESLDKITNGDLNEVVNVRSASEFTSLSRDINQTVDALKGYIAAAEHRIEQELEFARTIQDSSLPKVFTFPRKDFEIFATMDPAKEVGGDFYDFFFIGPDRMALVIADVSGKGIPAALFMMRSRTTIRGLANTVEKPDEILRRANDTLCEGNEAEMFVTVWLGLLNLKTGKMTCANAGHEYPVLMRAGGEYELVRDKHGLPLAVMKDIPCHAYELDLHPGDRLFVYTDGVPEAINEQTEQYGTDRMLAALNRHRDEPESALLPAVRKDVSDFSGTADRFDDITMLGFSYFGPQGT